MSRWFRFYDDVINDPKVLSLSDQMRWAWVAVLCIASKHDGKLPNIDHVALMLRVPKSRAAATLAALHSAGLLDRTETGFVPHNWSGRQYKSDVSTERVKRFRNGKRNVAETPPDTETETEDRIVDARASGSAFTEGSKSLTDAFWKAVGCTTPLDISPDYAGVDWRAIEWEKAGWTADLIDAETRRVGPGKPLKYYEKVFATAFAKRQSPLPVVQVQSAEKVTVTANGTSQNRRGNSLLDALDRRIAEAELAEKPDLALPAGAVLSLSDRPIR